MYPFTSSRVCSLDIHIICFALELPNAEKSKRSRDTVSEVHIKDKSMLVILDSNTIHWLDQLKGFRDIVSTFGLKVRLFKTTSIRKLRKVH